MVVSLSRRIAEFKTQFDRLPEATEPPATTLQILGRSRLEQDWQRLLFYFLSPNEPHGLRHALLEHVLTALSNRDDLSYEFSRYDLDTVRIETEVITSNNRRTDAVVWSAGEWFFCWELKVDSSEDADQTKDYVDARSFRSIDLAKADLPADGHHYVYLAPADSPRPAAAEFVPVSWEWVASELRSFLADSHGKYPARTTAQLDDFISTIQGELTMTEYRENQQEKANLYFEYYDEISDARDAFESQWAAFATTWGTRLAETLDVAELVDGPVGADDHVTIELDGSSGDRQRWHFRQVDSDWADIVKDGWWRRQDDLSEIYTKMTDKNDYRISLYHRLEQNRDLAVRDRTLELQLWHGTGNGDEFMDTFRDTISTLLKDRASEIPPTVEYTGRRGNPIVASYDIPVGEHSDFFTAYIAALNEAFLDIVVDNGVLVEIIDRAFEETLDTIE